MSHKFLRMMAKIQAFMSLPRCRVCESRACNRPGNCDDHAQMDRAIISCAQISHLASLEDCLKSNSFSGMDEGQVFLAYKAGEILARK